MTEKTREDSINARGEQSPGIDIPKRKGRPPKVEDRRAVNEILSDSAPLAAAILQKHIERQRGFRHLASDIQRACEYVIDHAIGKARQKVEHSGGIMTYGELAKSAEKLDSKPRPILAEVLEIAQKYQDKTSMRNPDPDPESGTKTDDKTEGEKS